MSPSPSHIEAMSKTNTEVESGHDLEQHGYADKDVQNETHVLEDEEYKTAEKKYLRRLDLIILPTISALYFFEYLDRGNVAVSLLVLHHP